MVVVHMVEEAFDIGFDDIARAFVREVVGQLAQCVMRTSPRPKPVRTVTELRLSDRLQDLAEPVLHDAIFKAGNP